MIYMTLVVNYKKGIIYVAFLAMISMICHCSCMIYPLVNKQGRTLYIHHKFKQDQIFMYKVVYVFVVFLFFVCLFVWWCLTPLSTIFQWRPVLLVEETEHPEKTTDLSQVTDKLYHIMMYRLSGIQTLRPDRDSNSKHQMW